MAGERSAQNGAGRRPVGAAARFLVIALAVLQKCSCNQYPPNAGSGAPPPYWPSTGQHGAQQPPPYPQQQQQQYRYPDTSSSGGPDQPQQPPQYPHQPQQQQQQQQQQTADLYGLPSADALSSGLPDLLAPALPPQPQSQPPAQASTPQAPQQLFGGSDLSQVDKDLIFEGLKKLYKKKVATPHRLDGSLRPCVVSLTHRHLAPFSHPVIGQVLPLEVASKYSHFSSPPMGPSDFEAKPMVRARRDRRGGPATRP